ncbi:MAG TPA: MFS transporter [Caulobacteraceae bacterium]|nr:MFS transporter [Caulobacteraceae bacterium]
MSDVAARPPLTLGTKVSYGAGSVVQSIAGVALSTSVINLFLIRVIGMDPITVGVVILISLVVDAVLDPAIGRFSDTFRSPWGRRHPFMYASALPIAVAIVLLWRPPHALTGGALAAYTLSMLVLLRICTSVYQIPSDALTPELAPDYHERTSLISFRYFFGIVGGTVAGAVLFIVFLHGPNGQLNREAYGNFFVLAAIVVFFAILGSSYATHRFIPFLRVEPKRQMTAGQTAREIWETVGNPSLVAVMAAGLLSGIAGGMAASLSLFMSFYFWGLSSRVIGVMGIFGLPAAILGVVLAPWISRTLDKKRTMLTVFVLAIFSGVVPVALRLAGVLPPNGSPWIPVILVADSFVSGTLALMGFVIVGSMIADVVEDVAVKTGRRSEGLLFAANGLLPKFTSGFGTLLGNAMLAVVHLPKAVASGAVDKVDPAIMNHLVWLSVPAGMVLNLLAVTALFLYRIDQRSHESNLAALALEAGLGGPPPTSSSTASPPIIEPPPAAPPV